MGQGSVGRLKRQLRRKYMAWHHEQDHLDCGIAMARVINPRLGRLENDMARIKSKLVQLGETVPALPGEEV